MPCSLNWRKIIAEWKKFTGSEEQFKEMNNAEHGWIARFMNGNESQILRDSPYCHHLNTATEYLICEPPQHAEMIERWARTGQPVYWFNDDLDEWELATSPVWNPNLKYSFNPPKEKECAEFRQYLWRRNQKLTVGCIMKSDATGAHLPPEIIEEKIPIKVIEGHPDFIRWLDDDWRKVEI